MSDFIYGNCVYFNDIYYIPNIYHEIFIHKICPDVNIITPVYILRYYLKKMKGCMLKHDYSMDTT